MAEEQGQERSQPASQRRLEKAREEGRVPRSVELATTAALGGGALAMWWTGPAMISGLGSMLTTGLRLERRDAFDASLFGPRLMALSIEAMSSIAPLIGMLVLVAIAAPLMVGGWVLSIQALQPQASRIDPLAGLGRIISAHGLVELAKAVLKAGLLGFVAGLILWKHRDALAATAQLGLQPGLAAAAQMLLFTLATLAGVMAFVAAIDVPVQIWHHHRALRMSLQELREESRESEGDPQIRARIRSQQREIARRRMMSAVPDADVVVTNPTHYAVALRYAAQGRAAPRVVAKGRGAVALRIREVAAQHGVPTLEAPPLARALYRNVELDAEIAPRLYDAVAIVLAWVYQLKRREGDVARPQDLPVPPELAGPEYMDADVDAEKAAS